MADQIPLASLSNPELERKLTDLGSHLYPVTPDLASHVRHQLESEAPGILLARTFTSTSGDAAPGPLQGAEDDGRSRGRSRRTWDIRQPLWLAAAILLILLAGVLALVPEARNAIADRLGLQGVLIRWVDEIPTPEPSPVGAPLLLGRPVTLDEARAAVGFPILIPTAAGFDAPPEIYLLDSGQGEMVSFVYPAGPGLPESDVTGVGGLLTQFEGEADRHLIEKGLHDDAGAMETRLEPITVGGEPGFWISGAPHGFFFVCYDVGECRQERYRLAGDVLLWEQDGLTLRLESTLSLDEARAVAESVRAPE